MFRFICLVTLIFSVFQLPAMANPVPPALEGSVDQIQSIQLNCGDTWLAENQSRIRYAYSDTTPNQDEFESEPDTNYPQGSYCGWFLAQLGQSPTDPGDSGGQSQIPQETLMWWQASIDFLGFTIRMGAIFYPVVFGLRVVHLIAHS